MHPRRLLLHFAAIGALALAAAGPASAQYITHRVVAGDVVFGGGPVPLLPLTNAFANAAGQPFVVTFSADCAVDAANLFDYTSVELYVWEPAIGAIVQFLQPTMGPADEFCTADGVAGFSSRARHSVTAVGGIGLEAGVYQVGVRAGVTGAANASYGNRIVVVTR